LKKFGLLLCKKFSLVLLIIYKQPFYEAFQKQCDPCLEVLRKRISFSIIIALLILQVRLSFEKKDFKNTVDSNYEFQLCMIVLKLKNLVGTKLPFWSFNSSFPTSVLQFCRWSRCSKLKRCILLLISSFLLPPVFHESFGWLILHIFNFCIELCRLQKSAGVNGSRNYKNRNRSSNVANGNVSYVTWSHCYMYTNHAEIELSNKSYHNNGWQILI